MQCFSSRRQLHVRWFLQTTLIYCGIGCARIMQLSICCCLLLFRLTASLTVHKCCPYLESLIPDPFKCVSNGNASAGLDDLSWFPFSALFDLKTELPLSASEQSVVKEWLNMSHVVQAGNFSNFHEDIYHLHDGGKYSYPDTSYFKIFVDHPRDMDVLVNVRLEFKVTYGRDPAFILPMDEVCFDTFDNGEEILHFLLFPGWKSFFKKCCPYGQYLNIITGTCLAIESALNVTVDDWLPSNQIKITHDYNLAVTDYIEDSISCNDTTLYEHPNSYNCRGFNLNKKRHFLPNGSMQVGDSILEPGSFCGEVTQHPNGEIIKHNLLMCLGAEKNPKNSTSKTWYGALFICGGLVLLLTVAISLYLPKLRERLHNKVAITHNVTLMVSSFAWGAQYFYDHESTHLSSCNIRALIVQFTFLASLFWLNVFCINMSSTFRTTRHLNSRLRNSENYRYFIYSLYAWGVPALITLFTIVMEVVEKPPFGIPRPGITCFCDFANDKIVRFIYIYGPMSMLLMSNITLYVFTTWKIMSVHRQTASVLKSRLDSSSKPCGATIQNDYQKLMLYTKLFFVMGITWSMEIINYICGIGDTPFGTVCDILNILRPLFIFVIFICKKDVFLSLKHRLKQTAGIADAERSTATDAFSMSGMNSRKISQCSVGMAGSEELARVQEALLVQQVERAD